jgi:hypothetical protein
MRVRKFGLLPRLREQRPGWLRYANRSLSATRTHTALLALPGKCAELGWVSCGCQAGSEVDQQCTPRSRAALSSYASRAQPATPLGRVCATLRTGFVTLVVGEEESMSEGRRTSL